MQSSQLIKEKISRYALRCYGRLSSNVCINKQQFCAKLHLVQIINRLSFLFSQR